MLKDFRRKKFNLSENPDEVRPFDGTWFKTVPVHHSRRHVKEQYGTFTTYKMVINLENCPRCPVCTAAVQ